MIKEFIDCNVPFSQNRAYIENADLSTSTKHESETSNIMLPGTIRKNKHSIFLSNAIFDLACFYFFKITLETAFYYLYKSEIFYVS